jgi:hypothetical protein
MSNSYPISFFLDYYRKLKRRPAISAACIRPISARTTNDLSIDMPASPPGVGHRAASYSANTFFIPGTAPRLFLAWPLSGAIRRVALPEPDPRLAHAHLLTRQAYITTTWRDTTLRHIRIDLYKYLLEEINDCVSDAKYEGMFDVNRRVPALLSYLPNSQIATIWLDMKP